MQRQAPAVFVKNKSKSKSQRRGKRRKRQGRQQQLHGKEIFAASASAPPQPPDASASSGGSRLWMQTYENIVRWQAEHQASFWKNLAQKFKNENEQLREKLQRYERKDDGASGSSSSEAEEEQFAVDEDYLDFMEVTRKHQESMRLLRAQLDEGGPPKAST